MEKQKRKNSDSTEPSRNYVTFALIAALIFMVAWLWLSAYSVAYQRVFNDLSKEVVVDSFCQDSYLYATIKDAETGETYVTSGKADKCK